MSNDLRLTKRVVDGVRNLKGWEDVWYGTEHEFLKTLASREKFRRYYLAVYRRMNG